MSGITSNASQPERAGDTHRRSGDGADSRHICGIAGAVMIPALRAETGSSDRRGFRPPMDACSMQIDTLMMTLHNPSHMMCPTQLLLPGPDVCEVLKEVCNVRP